ncbi:Protein of unknown function [Rhodovulum sp. ES.010]|uniref:tail completion protein gp17 n=1 Tax=Rhodovulum sp. ES.010 TaxID=1882821 RepID=UPI000927A9BD|nr:DUF3168 domain-containing protein [Rhodovulum sp. ES.010]SIO36483.1 Protein of unknown function [Rhodovulum sp. ES.010]
MEEEFRALLQAALAGVPVNWGAHPQGAGWPGVVLNVIGGAEGLTQQGPDGLFSGRVQADCYARRYSDAKALSRLVVAALDGHRGGGFRGVFRVATRDGRDDDANGGDRLFRVSLDFMTHWRAEDG